MKLDYTIKNIIIEIKNELKEEEGIDLSTQEIFNICNSQFIGAVLAKIKKISFSLSYIGNFLYKDLTYYFKNVKEANKVMKEMNDVEKKEFITAQRIFHKENFKGSKMKLIKDIKKLPSDVKDNKVSEYYKEVFKEIIYKEENE